MSTFRVAPVRSGLRASRRCQSTILCFRMPVSHVRSAESPRNVAFPSSAAMSVSCTTSSAVSVRRNLERA